MTPVSPLTTTSESPNGSMVDNICDESVFDFFSSFNSPLSKLISDNDTASTTSSSDTISADGTTSTTSSSYSTNTTFFDATSDIVCTPNSYNNNASITDISNIMSTTASKLPQIPIPENTASHRFTPKLSQNFPNDYVLGTDFSPVQHVHKLALHLADPKHLSLSLYEDIRLLKTYIWMGVTNYQSKTYQDKSCRIRFSHNHPTIISIMRFITKKQKQIRRILQNYVEHDLHFLFHLTSYEQVVQALKTKIYSPHILNDDCDTDNLIDISFYHYDDLFDILDTYMQLFFTFSNIASHNLSHIHFNVIPHIYESLDQSYNPYNQSISFQMNTGYMH